MVSPNPRDDDGNISLSSMELLDELGLDADKLSWRQSLVGLDDEDAVCPVDPRGVVEAHDRVFVDDFVEPILANERTADVIGHSKADLDGPRMVVSGYYRLFTDGSYDQSHYATRMRIDLLHDKLNVPLHCFGGVFVNVTGTLTDELHGCTVADATGPLSGEDADRTENAADEAFTDMMAIIRGPSLDQQVVNVTYSYSYLLDVHEEVRWAKESHGGLEPVTSQFRGGTAGASEGIVEIEGLTTRRADMTGKIATELSNLSATTGEIAAIASDVSSRSDETAAWAEEGRIGTGETIDTMRQVGDGHDEITVNVEALMAAVDKIQDIIGIIDEVVDRTNLLALSASIEVARAGEANSGFTVVANEVKPLVNESKSRAERIDQMIGDVTDRIGNTTGALSSAGKNINHGIERVKLTIESLDKITDSVVGMTDGIDEVTRTTDGQATLTSDITTFVDNATTQVNEVTAEMDRISESVFEQTEQVADLDTTIKELDREADPESFRRRAETMADGGVATKGDHYALASTTNADRTVGGGTGPASPTDDRVGGATSTSIGDDTTIDPTDRIPAFIK